VHADSDGGLLVLAGALIVQESLALLELEPLETLTENVWVLALRFEYEVGEEHEL
jgi:hypothetical protein